MLNPSGMAKIKESYKQLKAKYGLPDFDVLDNVFEIYDLDNDMYTLRKIRRQMIEKIKGHVEILEELIHPNSTVSSYHEYKFLDESNKKKIYDQYSRLMSLTRTSQRLDLECNEEKDAVFIKELHEAWPGLRAALIELIAKLNKCWTEEEISDRSLSNYLG